jgi:anti-sigma factor RsiW
MSEYLDIHALADGELAQPDRAAMEQRVAADPNLRRELEAVTELKQTVKTKVDAATCHKTWANCTQRLKELEKKRKAELFVGKYAWAMCCTIFALIIGAGLMNRNFGGSQVGTGDVARMMASLAPFSQRVPNNNVQDMGQWLKDLAGAPVTVETSGLRPLAHSQGVVDERMVNVFQMADNAGPLTLIVINGAERVNGCEPMVGHSEYSAGMIGRTNCVSWTDSKVGLILVGDRPHEQLGLIAERIRIR